VWECLDVVDVIVEINDDNDHQIDSLGLGVCQLP
jgi:hypothetical protein